MRNLTKIKNLTCIVQRSKSLRNEKTASNTAPGRFDAVCLLSRPGIN